ncbi:MAG: hypothetical protein JXA10_19725 [Anaerolineae bacterium]|nr:hypothetical protein [Anaerolineae bacterium]
MTTADDLQQAYQLIREDRSEEAEALLIPLLMTEPDNVDAWWLMAYAVEDPNEVREALNKVLELDPNYSQASKAREMLAQINAQHPPSSAAEESFFDDDDDLFGGDSTIDESFFDSGFEAGYEATPFGHESDELTADDLIFDDGLDNEFAASLAPPEGMMTAAELFGEEEEDIFGNADTSTAQPASAPRPATFTLDDIDEPLDDEDRAALEEQSGRREGRRRRWTIMALFVLIVFVVPIVLILVLLTSGGGGVSDPGPLESIVVESQAVNDARQDAGNQLRPVLGMDSQIVIAKSSFGDTFFAKICAQPGPDLSAKVWQAMDTVTRQAPRLEGELAAIGVSLENCSGAEHDTYYRAAVAMADAIRYANGDFNDETGSANFQALWKKS